MLEGAKSIGAGAATIASAGAAVGIGNVFSFSFCGSKSFIGETIIWLCHFGLCSNRSYCTVCPNDGIFDPICSLNVNDSLFIFIDILKYSFTVTSHFLLTLGLSFPIFIVTIWICLMEQPTRILSSSSGANPSNGDQKKKDAERKRIRHLITTAINIYMEKYQNQISEAYPKAHEIHAGNLGSIPFLNDITKYMMDSYALVDYDSNTELPLTLNQLKGIRRDLKADLASSDSVFDHNLGTALQIFLKDKK